MNPNSATALLGLRLNAALSLAMGSLLAGGPTAVGEWLGVSVEGWLRLLGVTLIGHAALLGWCSTQRPLAPWLRANLVMIAPYPLLMVALVVTGLVDTELGRTLVLADGAAVGAVALMQWRGLPSSTLEVDQEALNGGYFR